jgi:hypothetical protein
VLFREKKRHTIKTQVIINRRNGYIICVQQGYGHEHDFKLFKETIGYGVDPAIKEDLDSGYQGMQKIHANCRIPKKASKTHRLTKAEKRRNRAISRKRIVIEHVNAVIKVFKIFSEPYRNHLRRHLLRMSLICGIINFENRRG